MQTEVVVRAIASATDYVGALSYSVRGEIGLGTDTVARTLRSSDEFQLYPVVPIVKHISQEGKRVGLHGFRHALASVLVQHTGAAVAQRQLRHSDAQTTLGLYAHVMGNGHFNAIEK